MESSRIDLAHEPDFMIGRLTIHPSTREIADGDQRLVIEPRVMQVLAALYRAVGAVVSKHDLAQSCWEGRVVGEDAINRVLSRLRKVSDGMGKDIFRVETVTRVGYRLLIAGNADSSADPRNRNKGPAITRLGRRAFAVRAGMAIGAITIMISGTTAYIHFASPDASSLKLAGIEEILPDDDETAAVYLEAKRNWAKRQSASINDAIRGFSTVIARDPGYAPAYAGLADSYILAREFGSMSDHIAFPKAKSAAAMSINLAPKYSGGHRALGFVRYWWDNNPVEAGRSFRTALKLSPNDAQSHFWYGASLTDNGDIRAARRELDIARALNPESLAVLSDWAFVLYADGERDKAVQILNEIASQRPEFAGPFDCLRYIYLNEANFSGYFRVMTVLAALRQEPDLIAKVARERSAFEAGDVEAFKKLMIGNSARAPKYSQVDEIWSASIASALGDRDIVFDILAEADARGEKWGAAVHRHAIARRWKDDAQITALLARRAPLSMEP